MDMKKIMDAVKEPSRIEKTDAKDMHRFLSIVTEGKNTTTNRLSMAEQMAVQQYTPETKKNITNPVLNVSKDAKPSMIGKYFKAVEEEIAEAQERAKDRAKLIAERVISKMHSASKQRIEEYYNVPATDSKSPIPGHVSGCQCKEVEEGLKDPKDNPCWKGYKPVGTKKKGGRTVPNCVPKEDVAEGTDPNKLAASVTVDGEFKEFDLTPLIAKNNWVGTPKQVINLAEKYLGDFLRKRGSAYSNLELTYKGTTLKANQVGDVDAPDLEFESMQDVTEDWMDDVAAMAHKMAPQDKMRERQAQRAAQEKLERQQRIQQDIKNLPDLISQYNDMEAEYDSMGGKNWQYADREQNLSDEERRARGMETSMSQLADRIHTAKTAKNKGLAESDSGAKYKVKSIGHDAKGDYYISPSTGKKVYKKGVKVGDHENPKTGEHKSMAENTADGINKMFNNLGDPVYANLQRVALLAMQGRQQEAQGRLNSVIRDASPQVQKKITDAVNNIKPVTINGKIADSSRLDKSKQHNDWIINTFIPWVQSLLGQQGVAEGKVKLYTDPSYFGAEVDDTGFDSLPVVNIPADRLVGFEPDSKMYQPKSRANVEKIVAGLKKGNKLPPLLVRNYKNGYQVLDGHHRFWAYKLSGTKSIPAQIVPAEDIEEISKQGVAEGLEEITEYRDRMYQYIKSIVPGFPDYVVKDWLYANFARGATQGPNWSFDTIGKDIPNILKNMELSVDTKWQLVPNMKFTMDMWEPKTLKRLQARAGGSSKSTEPDVHIPARDTERHATQAQLAQQQGGVRKEPVILIKTSNGYELLEGWHRTIQHFHKFPDGYTGPAYVAVAQGQQGVAEGEPKGYDSDGNPQGGGYDEYNNDKKSWTVVVDGKTWKTFDDERQAYKAAAAIERKYGKKTRVYKN